MPERGSSRRSFLKAGGAAGFGILLDAQLPERSWAQPAPTTAPEVLTVVPKMIRFPQKTDLLLRTDRPPQLETPLKYFRDDLTPNEAFFVRWHLAGVPTQVDTGAFRLEIKGHVQRELALSLDDLRRQFEPVSVIAVNQCSGNSRSLFEPRVPGGQWGNGAVGNAKWTGVRLRALLAKAGARTGAVDVSFRGLDEPVVNTTPPFAKSLSFDKANDGDVLVAYEMNGQPLPMLNGFPCRLVVPGWYGTYWVKALRQITVLDKKFDSFWMDKAYRVPETKNYDESPSHLAEITRPISAMTTRSLIVAPEPGEQVPRGRPYQIEGVAFDGGSGIAAVELSTDAGRSWHKAQLERDLGRYSWRRFRLTWTPIKPGHARLLSRATNNKRQSQAWQQWNRSGYARDVMDPTDVVVG